MIHLAKVVYLTLQLIINLVWVRPDTELWKRHFLDAKNLQNYSKWSHFKTKFPDNSDFFEHYNHSENSSKQLVFLISRLAVKHALWKNAWNTDIYWKLLSAIGQGEILYCNSLPLILPIHVHKFSMIYKLVTLTLYRSHLMKTIWIRTFLN